MGALGHMNIMFMCATCMHVQQNLSTALSKVCSELNEPLISYL